MFSNFERGFGGAMKKFKKKTRLNWERNSIKTCRQPNFKLLPASSFSNKSGFNLFAEKKWILDLVWMPEEEKFEAGKISFITFIQSLLIKFHFLCCWRFNSLFFFFSCGSKFGWCRSQIFFKPTSFSHFKSLRK